MLTNAHTCSAPDIQENPSWLFFSAQSLGPSQPSTYFLLFSISPINIHKHSKYGFLKQHSHSIWSDSRFYHWSSDFIISYWWLTSFHKALSKFIYYCTWGLLSSLLAIHPKDTSSSHKDTWSAMFVAVLLIICRICKQPICPSLEKWTNKMWYIDTTEYCLICLKNGMVRFTHKWKEPEKIILNEVTDPLNTVCIRLYMDIRL